MEEGLGFMGGSIRGTGICSFAWFKKACANSISIDCKIIRKKALPVTPHLGVATK
jgi:hypothetical protein